MVRPNSARAGDRRARSSASTTGSTSFEHLIGFPRYVLLRAEFGKAADSAAARAVTVVWSLVVGASGIGGFVVGLLALNR